MQLSTLIRRRLVFSPLEVQHTIALDPGPTSDFTLHDARLRLNGARGGPPNRLGVESLNVYLGEHDLTSNVVAAFRDSIAAADGAAFRAQLQAAYERRFVVYSSMGSAYPGDLAADQAIAESVIQASPLSSILHRLGDRSIGSMGLMDPFQFLFTEVDLAPISLRAAWADYEAANGTGLDPFGTDGSARLTLSEGARPIRNSQWTSSSPVRGGAVDCALDVIYSTAILDDLRVELETILGHVGQAGTIQSLLLGDLTTSLDRLTAEVALTGVDVDDLKLRLISLGNDAAEIRALIEAL